MGLFFFKSFFLSVLSFFFSLLVLCRFFIRLALSSCLFFSYFSSFDCFHSFLFYFSWAYSFSNLSFCRFCRSFLAFWFSAVSLFVWLFHLFSFQRFFSSLLFFPH